MGLVPVVAARLLDGRVGSTLLMQLLGTSPVVALERRYPEGELRYLSYCLRVAEWIATPWDPERHLGVTEMLFGPEDRGGPLPFTPTLVDAGRLGRSTLRAMWSAVSDELLMSRPHTRYYTEKLVGDGGLLLDCDIPLFVIDLVRDPRDVFCSIRSFTGGAASFGRLDGQSDDEFLDQMVGAHRARLRAMAGTPPDVPRLVVRYEDLVADLSGAAKMLGRWLGIVLDADVVMAAREDYKHHMTSETPEASIGRWRRELTPNQATKVWDVLGPDLAALGYRAD